MTDEELDGMTAAELRQHLMASIEQASEVLAPLFSRLHKRPLLGGPFGAAGYFLCSYCVTVNGLQEVHYYVASEHGMFLGTGQTKATAISVARRVLETLDLQSRVLLLERFRVVADAKAAEIRRVETEKAIERRATTSKIASIPRRRRLIFEESGGKCHYCETVLTLDGKWHIEHKMPKALGGDSQPGNLVASCAPCNHKKRDTTDVEFKARLAAEATV